MGRLIQTPQTKPINAADGWSHWFEAPAARSPNFRALLGAKAWRRLPAAVRVVSRTIMRRQESSSTEAA